MLRILSPTFHNLPPQNTPLASSAYSAESARLGNTASCASCVTAHDVQQSVDVSEAPIRALLRASRRVRSGTTGYLVVTAVAVRREVEVRAVARNRKERIRDGKVSGAGHHKFRLGIGEQYGPSEWTSPQTHQKWRLSTPQNFTKRHSPNF